MDLTIIGFFFLLRPGEHCYDKENNHPFRLQDVSFQSVNGTTNAATISTDDLMRSLHWCTLNSQTKKMETKVRHISHGDTAEALVSPLKAVRRRVQHLRLHKAPPNTPLHTVYLEDGTTTNIRSNISPTPSGSVVKPLEKTLGSPAKKSVLEPFELGEPWPSFEPTSIQS